MQHCVVSVAGGDGQVHTVEVNASSLFGAVDQAAAQWARLWWYAGTEVVDVKAGERTWRVRLHRVREWRASQRGIVPEAPR